MNTVISVQNLSKKFLIHHKQKHNTIRDVLGSQLQVLTGKILRKSNGLQDEEVEEFWALREVNFEIKKGESVGIIGRNGAGKSTLLKILSRITEPSSGRAIIEGRIASLLEVGTGFHPELTGRENIFLNGAILGMSKREIKNRFDEIVAFSDVEKFLDTPVKHYSSGMYVRLAFAVAAHLEPEVLIVDEVLAVGDAQFQKKCMGKLNEAGSEGRTVLFVSHNMSAMQSLCNNAVWLEAGRIKKYGKTNKIVMEYLQSGSNSMNRQIWEDPDHAPGNDKVRLKSIKAGHTIYNDIEAFNVETPIDIQIEIWNLEPLTMLNFSVVLYDSQENCLFNTVSTAQEFPKGVIRGVCHIPGNLLNDGIYRVRLLVVKDKSIALVDMDNVCSFEVQDIPRQGMWHGKWVGAVRPKLMWETEIVG